MKIKVLTSLFIAMMCFAACEKEDNEPKNVSNEAETTPTPAPPGDADGVLVALSAKSTVETVVGQQTVYFGSGVALFFENGVNDALVAAGKVTLNSAELTRAENNAYFFRPGPANPSGMDFSTNIAWSVEGGNNVPAISFDNKNKKMPAVGENTSPDDVSKNASYTVSASSVSNADSVLFVLGELSYTASGNTTSHTFTANEISANLKDGETVAIVAPYNLNPRIVSNKKYYFINEVVTSKVVTVKE